MRGNHFTFRIVAALLALCVAGGAFFWLQHTRRALPVVEQSAPVSQADQPQGSAKSAEQASPAFELPVAQARPESQDSAATDPHDMPMPNPEDAMSAAKGKEVITGTVAKGDTATMLLNTWLPVNAVHSLLEVTRKIYSLSQIHEGQPYTLIRDVASGELESFEYEIDSNRKLVILRQEESFSAKLESIAYETRLVLVEGAISSNLFQAVTEAGEQPALAMLIADIFAWEINFIKDLRTGDTFSILVEKRYRQGEFRNYGKVLAAIFVNQNTKYEAYRFADAGGHFRFFNPKGESLEKTLLKAPLPFTRVTSGYTMRRFHPIFQENRPHQGIDYGAPAGTPIKAVGSGAVTFAGWAGGYGKQVIIRHSSKLESLYSHMSNYARGIRAGGKVRQGQIIGYVGATGNATGPHLDFRLRQNGAFINPAKAINPRIADLEKKRLPALQRYVVEARDYFSGKRALSEYAP
ncbi:MAG: peptidoglycan DD-metalloendopeptidase family protein [Deltaproteobacteria bacterium]|jgi:murein DD-endopeptidase MepM/ murein hydrolase activator NlpD|nr:peptidoglycan DD-metalloendopeptidase family protein [Deltaproteobacteria bacterium]